MIKYEKKEIEMEISLKKRVEFVCDFNKLKPKFINGNVIKIKHTNIQYIEPHRIVIDNTTFLVFNYSTELYIENLNEKLELKDLEEYLKNKT